MSYHKKRYSKNCEICNKDFIASNPQTLTCSKICRFERYKKISGREGWRREVTTGTMGAISEMVVAVDLLKKGFAVFRALSPSCFCDLVAVKDGKSYFIEVRTAILNRRKPDVSFQKKTYGKIDYFGVFVPDKEKVFYFSSKYQEVNL